MNREKFDELHKRNGGIKKLEEMMSNVNPITTIADYFGVGKNAVRLWGIEIFGKNYDPRKLRHSSRIKELLVEAKKMDEEEFRRLYLPLSKHYYYIALSECYRKKIYVEK